MRSLISRLEVVSVPIKRVRQSHVGRNAFAEKCPWYLGKLDTLDNFDKVEKYYSSRFIKKYVDLLKEFIDTFFEKKDCLEDLRSAIQMVLTSRQVYRALISHHLKDNNSFKHAQVPRKCRGAIRLLIKHGILKQKDSSIGLMKIRQNQLIIVGPRFCLSKHKESIVGTR